MGVLLQPLLQLLFTIMFVGHIFEVAYCAYRCRQLGFTPRNSAKWMLNVAANGVWALSLLPKSKDD